MPDLNQGQARVLQLLAGYATAEADEQQMLDRLRDFVSAEADCLLRSLLIGHLTASALVYDHERQAVLLIFHRKLERWLQPGGHADGDADLMAVAIKEVAEECGISCSPWLDGPLDVDIHTIPERKGVPEHEHFDVRFLLRPEPGASLQINSEVLEARWVHLNEVESLIQERSVLRMVDKLQALKANLF